MRLSPLPSAALLALLLSACGGNLEGGTSTSESVIDTVVPGEAIVPTVDVAKGTASYFSYEGVSSDWITIKGVGAQGTQETATVSFKVMDANGDAVQGEVVNFELLSPPKGTTLSVDSATSGEDGFVSTLIKSGFAAGPITVKVTLVSDTSIYKTSNKLSVSTGYPDQDSITLAVETASPEALNYIVSNGITVYLGGGEDNTAVPDGTVVNFMTNSGRITDESGTKGFCTTVGSECKMKWLSTKPDSANGRAVITAYSVGEESFTDANEDGLYTEGEVYIENQEAFADINHDGIRDEGENFEDNGERDYAHSTGDGKYTGMLCPKDATYCNHGLVNVYASTEIVISGSSLSCDFKNSDGDAISVIDLTTAGTDSVTFKVSVYDANNNTPPAESVVSSIIENGALAGSKSSWTIPSSIKKSFDFTVTLKREEKLNQITRGNAIFDITTPKGNESSCLIAVIDDAAPEPTPTPVP